MKIMREDENSKSRATAAYLLGYIKDGPELSNVLSYALTDPSDEVRDAAMRVYTDIGIYSKDVPLPVHQISRLLDYPFAADREQGLRARGEGLCR